MVKKSKEKRNRKFFFFLVKVPPQRPKEILFIDVILDYFLTIKNIMCPFRKNYLFQTNAVKDQKKIIM